MRKIYCEHIEQIDTVAKELIEMCKDELIWVFKGQMGAGKTTLIKSIANQFGIRELVASPTFSIVNEYVNESKEIFFHFDFYRIDDQEEALEIGVEEYFYSGKRCWIEWAERIPDYIPESFMLINIEIDRRGGREIYISKIINGVQYG
ncbi:tRNA (adenosine(37)-N6)-threonylcarbamoyltransferase complex ATPase subunit type 1 TsaE [Belliella kenyensis]|uniref:tRNA threonylcarbamoyladenosine biosynthesis protein TsaE n=1 Tax=Belliella kenyensis TaxID=1472724 RepID=A0ABV8EMY8_9BACT|nr:tRNA (adenosine(37)-N6)-threonylcarbamoyltransferase complex ATPase subunit type 1 TsaE [Belliella kenyensis]MCH7403637.1 tRNA (adenosine(37)-N6)-threonylcarbamoyltransferase complex ATPase subunit type 1 TsaE [Belliella kenyensis]MDN3602210.1 tRNA (adenosine(37)-N6)-threonylcarbamoyltransferase complex ATPase subunit type 1 TsaE [Belliella kenyensis]